MNIQEVITSNVYIYAGLGFIALIILIFLLRTLIKPKRKGKVLGISYVNDLYEALGRKDNIKSIELVQKRLQIEVSQIKTIDQVLLKKLDTPAFVTGKKITLLIKDNANEVFKYLNEKRKEEA